MDQDVLKLDKQTGYLGFLLAAVYVLGVGITYFGVAFVLSGVIVFQGIVVV